MRVVLPLIALIAIAADGTEYDIRPAQPQGGSPPGPDGQGGPGPGSNGQTDNQGGNPPLARGVIERGIAAAFLTEGLDQQVVDGTPTAEATNAFIDYLYDTFGFAIPSGHRDEVNPDVVLANDPAHVPGTVPPTWDYWPDDPDRTDAESPKPDEIAEALGAAYDAISTSAGPSCAAGIAFALAVASPPGK